MILEKLLGENSFDVLSYLLDKSLGKLLDSCEIKLSPLSLLTSRIILAFINNVIIYIGTFLLIEDLTDKKEKTLLYDIMGLIILLQLILQMYLFYIIIKYTCFEQKNSMVDEHACHPIGYIYLKNFLLFQLIIGLLQIAISILLIIEEGFDIIVIVLTILSIIDLILGIIELRKIDQQDFLKNLINYLLEKTLYKNIKLHCPICDKNTCVFTQNQQTEYICLNSEQCYITVNSIRSRWQYYGKFKDCKIMWACQNKEHQQQAYCESCALKSVYGTGYIDPDKQKRLENVEIYF